MTTYVSMLNCVGSDSNIFLYLGVCAFRLMSYSSITAEIGKWSDG